MRQIAYELFSVASRLLNVILGGSADMTFSARVYMDGWERTEAVIDRIFWELLGEANHCEVWFYEDVRRAVALTARVKRPGPTNEVNHV